MGHGTFQPGMRLICHWQSICYPLFIYKVFDAVNHSQSIYWFLINIINLAIDNQSAPPNYALNQSLAVVCIHHHSMYGSINEHFQVQLVLVKSGIIPAWSVINLSVNSLICFLFAIQKSCSSSTIIVYYCEDSSNLQIFVQTFHQHIYVHFRHFHDLRPLTCNWPQPPIIYSPCISHQHILVCPTKVVLFWENIACTVLNFSKIFHVTMAMFHFDPDFIQKHTRSCSSCHWWCHHIMLSTDITDVCLALQLLHIECINKLVKLFSSFISNSMRAIAK